jgi:hypothetical protein
VNAGQLNRDGNSAWDALARRKTVDAKSIRIQRLCPPPFVKGVNVTIHYSEVHRDHVIIVGQGDSGTFEITIQDLRSRES